MTYVRPCTRSQSTSPHLWIWFPSFISPTLLILLSVFYVFPSLFFVFVPFFYLPLTLKKMCIDFIEYFLNLFFLFFIRPLIYILFLYTSFIFLSFYLSQSLYLSIDKKKTYYSILTPYLLLNSFFISFFFYSPFLFLTSPTLFFPFQSSSVHP